MRLFFCFFGLLFVLGGAVQLSHAQSDTFNVRVLYGTDAEAPTIPAPLSVTPVVPTQIDIAWGTSTDNIGVTGYQLFRDAVQIATTTLTSFSDTGLTASTTYAYNVVAFDSFGNFSTSSVTLATTTLAIPAPPVVATSSTSTRSESATIARLQLQSFDVTPSTNGVKFSFDTNLPTQTVLRYGQTSIYDDGAIESPIYKRSHTTSLFPLEAGTSYEYELYGFDRFGQEVLLRGGTVSTLDLPDTTAPANVANFSATPFGTDIFLGWNNPADDDFAFVRVVRNHLFYPTNDSDGFLVYSGTANSFTDQGGLSEYDTQYYTIFTYDSSENSSSGAIAYATLQSASEVGMSVEQGVFGTVPVGSVGSNNATITDATSTVDMTVLYAGSVEIWQGDQRQTLSDQSIVLDSRLPYELFIPITAVPENLKTIIVSVTNPSNQRVQDTYLLKINEDQTGYSALVPPPMVVGDSRITVEMIDFTLGTIRRIEQTIQFTTSTQPAPPLFETFSRNDVWPFVIQGSVVSFLLFLLYIIFAVRRKSEDK